MIRILFARLPIVTIELYDGTFPYVLRIMLPLSSPPEGVNFRGLEIVHGSEHSSELNGVVGDICRACDRIMISRKAKLSGGRKSRE